MYNILTYYTYYYKVEKGFGGNYYDEGLRIELYFYSFAF